MNELQVNFDKRVKTYIYNLRYKMELKRYNKESCVAVWSNSKNHGQLLACASANPSNNNLFDLQILSVDLADPSKNLNIEGKSMYNTSYRCLAWGTFGQKQGTYPYGLIFGGMQNGSFTLWNPADMIGKHDNVEQAHIDDQKAFLYAEEVDQDGYPIICAQWNPLKTNFLAYGSTSLLLLDVARDISSPDIMKPSSNNPHQGSYITSVTWNKQVAHILASAGSDGLIALYDIKTNRSIFTFRDNSTSNNTRQVQIAWSKHISTQIAVTLDDQKKNQLQIWDLRNQKGPIVVIDKCHSKGINSMDWSELDHDLILTASRERKIACWNYKQDQQPLSVRQIDSEIVKVAWSKALPSIYSVTTVDGLSICSLDDKNIHSYIPKWLKVPASTAFNGNQSVLVYSEERGNTMHEYSIKAHVRPQLIKQLQILNQLLQNQTVQDLKDADGETGEFWKLITTKKNQQGDSDIYDFLGLNKQTIIKQVEKYTGKKRDSFTVNTLKSSKSKAKSKSSKADYIPVSGFEAASFFGSLSTEPLDKSFTKNDEEGQQQNVKYDMVPRNFNWDIGKQKLIKQNMLIGNYEGAIDAALKCGRTAQALIIAYSIDQTTFNSTLKTFFTETTDNFISGILRHIAFKDSQELVKKYDLDKWKQCIALIFSLSSSEKRKSLLTLLANRLLSEEPESDQHQQAAVYCYILAEQFESIVQLYNKKIAKEKPNSRARKLSIAILGTRLLAIYACMTVNIKQSQTFERIIRELALVCLEADRKILSYNILTKYIPKSSNQYIEYLIHNTNELAQYRNHSNPIVSLPVMNKRQQKTKKPVGKNQQPNTQYPQQVPTNIKPNQKQPKNPTRITAFNQPQPEPKPQQFTQKAKGNVPPPPPPAFGKQNVQPVFTEQKQKNLPPPPPPGKRGAYQQQEDEEEEEKHAPVYQQPPTHVNRGNIPPPPPPKHVQQHIQRPQSYEQPDRQSDRQVPVPPPKKNVPPPPPSHQMTHARTQQEPTPPIRAVYNTNTQSQPKLPPPPPGRREQPNEDNNTSYEQINMKKNQPPPPPIKQSITPPPPPPAGNIKSMSIPQNQPRSNMPPPPKQAQYQQEEDDEEDEEDQYQQQPQQIQRNVPQPPSIKKNVPPPPPHKPMVKQESQQSYSEEQQLSSSQQGRRGPPPPPAKKNLPPPPRR